MILKSQGAKIDKISNKKNALLQLRKTIRGKYMLISQGY